MVLIYPTELFAGVSIREEHSRDHKYLVTRFGRQAECSTALPCTIETISFYPDPESTSRIVADSQSFRAQPTSRLSMYQVYINGLVPTEAMI